MPTYDYKCDECDAVKEVVHLITEDPDIPCPESEDHGMMSRKIGSPDVMFKGPGFTCNSDTKRAINKAAKQAKREGMNI